MAFTTFWWDEMKAIRDHLVEAIQAIEDTNGDPAFKEVLFTRKAKPKQFPSCLIFANPIRPIPTTVASSRFPFIFEVHAIALSQDNLEGFDEANNLLGLITKLFEDDNRQFDYLVDTSEIDRIIPEVDRPRVRTRHEAAVIIRFMKWVSPR